MSLLPIPQPVDDALEALALRRSLPKEIASLLFSVGRHVIRAFGEGGANQEETDKIRSRLDRCLALLVADRAIDPDGTLGDEVKRLAAAVDAAASGYQPQGVPFVPAEPSAPVPPPAPVPVQVRLPPSMSADPPRFVARAPAVGVPSAPRSPAPAPPPVEPGPELEPLVVHPFPESAAAEIERDWYWFVLEELNGLGTLLAYQRQHGETDAAARTERRVHATLDTLRWDSAVAFQQAWGFVARRSRDGDDVWGPHLVLSALEPQADRVRDWRGGLAAEMQAVIEGTQLETARGMR